MATSSKDVVSEGVRLAEAAALRALVEKSEYDQASLAKASGVGSKAFLWQLLRGVRPLNLEAACLLAGKLGVPLDSFTPRLAGAVRNASKLVVQPAPEPPSSPKVAESLSAYAVQKSPGIWPFSSVTPRQWELLGVRQKAMIEGYARGLVDAVGLGDNNRE